MEFSDSILTGLVIVAFLMILYFLYSPQEYGDVQVFMHPTTSIAGDTIDSKLTTDWKYSDDSIGDWHTTNFNDETWIPVKMPLKSNNTVLYLRGNIQNKDKIDALSLKFVTNGCIDELYLNGQSILLERNCEDIVLNNLIGDNLLGLKIHSDSRFINVALHYTSWREIV